MKTLSGAELKQLADEAVADGIAQAKRCNAYKPYTPPAKQPEKKNSLGFLSLIASIFITNRVKHNA